MIQGPSAAEIEAAKTPRGGWTRATLAAWGIPWPPPRGWRKRLIAGPALVAFEDGLERPSDLMFLDEALALLYYYQNYATMGPSDFDVALMQRARRTVEYFAGVAIARSMASTRSQGSGEENNCEQDEGA